MILTTTVDAEARQSSPSANYAAITKLGVNGGGSSDARRAFLYFPRPFPPGVTILSATLRVRLGGAWTGTNNLTVKRISTAWAESTLTWNRQPTVVATHSAAATVTGGTAGQTVSFDVTNIMQDVSAGGAYFGFRVELTQHATRLLYSSEWGTPTLRPELEITWSEAPEAPDRLGPDAGLSVSTGFPVLSWRFTDKAGDTTQSSAQVQLMQDSDDFTSPDYDTTKIALADSQWDSNDGSFAGIGVGETWYWRVKVWDGTDLESEWSEPATFTRTNLGTLTIDSPGATAPETTPPIEWTLSGGTQESYAVTLYSVNTAGVVTRLYTVADVDGVTDSVTPPANLIKTGFTYRATVEVWDTVDRYAGDHLTTSQDFTYALDGTPDPVDTLTVQGYLDGDGATTPAVQIDWSRATAPDAWCLVVDGVEVHDTLDLVDTHVSGDDYRLIYWGAKPRTTHTYEIRSVVTGVGMSTGNPTADYTTRPIGIWLIDDHTPGFAITSLVCIYGQDEADVTIGETGTTYTPIGAQSPVRITDIIRGYEGTVTGVLISESARDAFLAMKELEAPLRLILGDLNIPVRIEESHVVPTPNPGDIDFSIGFAFFQCGAPWPIDRA